MKSKFSTKTLWYLSGQIVQALSVLIPLPILLKNLNPNEYSVFIIITISSQLLAIVLGLGIVNPLTRSYFDRTLGTPDGINFLGYVCIMSLGTVAFALVFISYRILNLDYQEYALMTVLLSWIMAIKELGLSRLRAEGAARTYFFFASATSILSYSSVVLVFQFVEEIKVSTVIFVFLLGHFLPTLFLFIKFWPKKMNLSPISSTLRIAVPIIPHSLGVILLVIGDRYLLALLSDAQSVSTYQIGYLIGNVGMFLILGVNNVFSVFIYSLEKKDRFVVLAKYSDFLLSLIIVFTNVILLSIPLVIHLAVPTTYNLYDISVVAGIITLATPVYAIYLVFASTIFSRSDIAIFSWATSFSLLFSAVANYFMIRSFGIIGAAIVSTLTYVIQAALVSRHSIKNDLGKWDFRYYSLSSIILQIFCFMVLFLGDGKMYFISLLSLVVLNFTFFLFLSRRLRAKFQSDKIPSAEIHFQRDPKI